MKRPSRAGIGAGIACGALALLAGYQLIAPISVIAHPIENARTLSAGGPTALVPTSPQATFAIANDLEIERRPLFVPGRQPPSKNSAVQVSAQATNLDKYLVVGIIRSPDHAQAVLRGPTGDAFRLRQGEKLEGWILETIQTRSLTFSASGAHQQLDMKIGRTQQGQANVRTDINAVPRTR